MTDSIEIHKDKILLELTSKMALLRGEEVGFLLEKYEMNENNRNIFDVAKDIVDVYEKTNEHLKAVYPGNTVAESWIGANNFSVQLWKEKLLMEEQKNDHIS